MYREGNSMKILKIIAKNLPLFEKELEIDFYAEARINPNSKDELFHLFSNRYIEFYLNRTLTFIGKNAAGKTQILRVISFVMTLIQAKPINRIESDTNVLNLNVGECAVFEVYFYENHEGVEKLHKLRTSVERIINEDTYREEYIISSENLFTKEIDRIKSKKEVFDFSDVKIEDRQNKKYMGLSNDVSMLNLFYNVSNKTEKIKKIHYHDQLFFTNHNFLSTIRNDFPNEILEFLDPSIEYLEFKRNESKIISATIKFKEKEETIKIDNIVNLGEVLSSGTIKGFGIFLLALVSLERGGYLIIDELENHFNREIVATLIRFFLNSKMNVMGATLIYSSHYAELIDTIDRNDSIYIVRKQKNINIEKLSKTVKRNDSNKSYLFVNALLDQVNPSYTAVNDLSKEFRKKITGALKDESIMRREELK